LSLTSHDFDGVDDYITVTDAASLDGMDALTISAWVKATDAGDSTQRILEKDYSTAYSLAINRGSNDYYYMYINDNSLVGTTGSVTYGVWQHVVMTYDSTGSGTGRLYLNGVLNAEDTTFSGSAVGANSSNLIIAARTNLDGSARLDGGLRDIKMFKQALSADQVASLYSGSFNVTPAHWWKIDEDTGATGTIEDYGTGTDADGTGTSLGAYTNGTLDLDGTLTIAANGTLSAPRGTLDISNSGDNLAFHSNATVPETQFIHNNGTVLIDPLDASGCKLFGSTTNNGTKFYNLTLGSSATTNIVKLSEKFIVENHMDVNAKGRVFAEIRFGIATATTASEGGTVDTGASFQLYGGDLLGLSTIFPCVFSGDGIDHVTPSVSYNIANLDWSAFTYSPNNNPTTTLTGDMKFGAVTVNSGDTLDLNGQRAEFGGAFDLNGSLDLDGSLAIFKHTLDLGGKSPSAGLESDADTVIIHDPPSTSEKAITSLYAQGTFFAKGAESEVTGYAWGGASTQYPAKIFVGGALDCQQNVTAGNWQVATGGELLGTDRTLTVTGDFTTSGGLLGASCLTLNGSDEFAAQTSATTWGINNAYTIEMWLKTSTDSDMVLFDMDNGSDNANRIVLACNSSTNEIKLSAFASDGTETGLFTGNVFGQDFHDGKWHHLAVTNSGSEIKIYADGKLNKQLTATVSRSSDPSMRLFIGKKKNDSEFFNGEIEEVRIFTDVRTEAEIRADMFQGGTLANSGNLSARYSFDEGSGTAVDNSQGTDGRDLVASGTGVWAGAGTFTYGTSTLKMTGTSKKINYTGDLSVYKLTIATGGDSNAITMNEINGNNSGIVVYHTLEQESGKLASTSNEYIQIGRTFGNVLVASGKGAIAFADIFKFFIFQNSTSGTMNFPSASSADKNITTKRLFITSSSSIEALIQGDLTLTEELEISGGNTFNANGNTIAVKLVDSNAGTLDLRNSTMNFSVTGSGDQLNLDASSTLLTGNTTITGNSTLNKTDAILPAAGGFEVVGDVKFLKMNTDADLTVIGSVVDCILEDSTANIRQWHHTLDTQQLLDADEAGDDDLRLTKPALDNALELMTK